MIWENLFRLKDADKQELLDMKDVEGNLPLQVAIRFNNEYMCRKVFDYIEKKVLDEKICLRLKGTAAFQASESGNLKMLKLFISPKINEPKEEITFDKLLKARFNNGYTYLHVAAKQSIIFNIY